MTSTTKRSHQNDTPRRLVILSAREPDSELMAQAQQWSRWISVHVYAFNPARDRSAFEVQDALLLNRLRGASNFQIGWIAAYLMVGRRLRARSSGRARLAARLFPAPAEARGLLGWLWRWQIRRALYRRCLSLSIPPLAFVAADDTAAPTARRLSLRYRCMALDARHSDAVSAAIQAVQPAEAV